jgi:hypothetical protein
LPKAKNGKALISQEKFLEQKGEKKHDKGNACKADQGAD